MRVRSQLAITLTLLVGFTAALIMAIYFLGARSILFRQIQSQALSIAVIAASQVDGDLHDLILTPEDEGRQPYRTIQDKLRTIRDVNRRSDIYVRFVYTMRPVNGGRWNYVVDAEPPGPNHSAVGDPVIYQGDPLHLDRPYAEADFSKDRFGTWLSANAPIHDASGRPVALLGIDLAATDVLDRMNRLFAAGLIATAAALAAGAACALLIAGWFTTPLEQIGAAVRRIGEGHLDTRLGLKRKDEFGTLAGAVNNMAAALRERDALKGALARYVSREVAEEILAGQSIPTLRGARCDITVLIIDIRNFTGMSSSLAAEETVAFLNQFFSRMIDSIFGHRGTLDKFLGDGCLAIFGAPLPDPQHQRMAVLAALSMLRSIRELGDSMRAKYGIDLRVGIGLHSGSAIVGNIGSEQRMEFTAIGDTVNVASRLEALNKEYGTQILLSEAVVKGAGEEFNFRQVGEVTPRGLSQPIKIYTIPA